MQHCKYFSMSMLLKVGRVGASILFSRKHLVISGDIFDCHILRRRCYSSSGLRSGMLHISWHTGQTTAKDDLVQRPWRWGWEAMVDMCAFPVRLSPHHQGLSLFSLGMFRAWHIVDIQILLKELVFYLFCILSEIHSTELDSWQVPINTCWYIL